MNKNIRLTQQAANAISGYLEAVKQMTGLSYTQIISQRLQADLSRDPFGLGGRWSAKASERRAARRAERAERQERKAAEPKPKEQPKEQPKDDEWTHSEWMAELRRLYMAKADTLEGDEQKAFCEASLPRFKVEDDARKFLAELKAEAEADDW